MKIDKEIPGDKQNKIFFHTKRNKKHLMLTFL